MPSFGIIGVPDYLVTMCHFYTHEKFYGWVIGSFLDLKLERVVYFPIGASEDDVYWTELFEEV